MNSLIKKNINLKIVIEKLSYIIKIFNYSLLKINNDFVEVETNNKIIIKIYFSKNFSPSFMIIETDDYFNNNAILEFLEDINNNIVEFERVEDLVYEIGLIIENNKSNKKIKNFVSFHSQLDLKKKEMYENCIVPLKLFTKKSLFEMIMDEIIKINKNENFVVEVVNFFEYNICINKFIFTSDDSFFVKINLIIFIDSIYYYPKISLSSNFKLKNNLFNLIENLKPFSNKKSWSIKYSVSDCICKIFRMINIYGQIEDQNDNEFLLLKELETLFSINISKIGLSKLLLEVFDSNIINSNENNFWKKGTGYGNILTKDWDIDEYIQSTNTKNIEINLKIKSLVQKIFMDNLFFENNLERIIEIFYCFIENNDINNNVCHETIIELSNIVNLNLEKIKIICPEKCIKIIDYIEEYFEENSIENNFNSKNNKKIVEKNINEKNINEENICSIDKYIFNYSSLQFSNFYYNQNIFLTSENMNRLNKEFKIIKKNIINSENSSIFFMVDKNNIGKMRFIISGPKDTCYEYGLMIFDMTIQKDFPNSPPLVNFVNHGNKRFNPNIYDTGKVCLSLLGTWSGDKGESWNSQTSSLFQLILSIQTQILVEEPYFNEPGFEKYIGMEYGIIESQNYNSRIKKYVMDHAINDLLESVLKNKDNFIKKYDDCENIIIDYFKLNKNSIIKSYKNWSEKNSNHTMDKSIEKFIFLVDSL